MGSSLTANYSDIDPLFEVGVWKLHSAIRRGKDPSPVTLWLLNYDLMKQKERNKKLRRKYLTHIETSLRFQTKISHPSVLHVIEISPPGKSMGFASEPISSVLSRETSVTRDEAVYLSYVLARVLRHVQTEHHVVFAGATPDNIFFKQNFTMKLGLFVHSAPFTPGTSALEDPFTPYSPTSCFHSPVGFVAPELAKDNNFHPSTDIYMYGICILHAFANRSLDDPVSIPAALELVPPGYTEILQGCLAEHPPSRPTFDAILEDDVFSSLVCGVFRYLEAVHDKTGHENFAFLKGLKTIIAYFSVRLVRQRFLPFFWHLVNKNIRYGPVVVPLFLAAEGKFTDEQFVDEVLKPLKPILQHVDRPKILRAFLDRTDVIVKRLPQSKWAEFVYPVLFAGLKSGDNALNEQVLVSLPYFLGEMEDDIARDVMNGVAKKLHKTSVELIAVRAVSVMELSILKLGGLLVTEVAVPAILSVWRKQHWALMAPPIVNLLYNLDVPIDLAIARIVCLAADMLSYRDLHPMVQARLIVLIRKTVGLLQVDHNITPEMIETMTDYETPPPNYPDQPYEPRGDDEEAPAEGEEEAPPAEPVDVDQDLSVGSSETASESHGSRKKDQSKRLIRGASSEEIPRRHLSHVKEGESSQPEGGE